MLLDKKESLLDNKKSFVKCNKSVSLLALTIGLAVSGSAYASNANILPPAKTGDLFALEDGCDCVLRITPDKTITVEITEAEMIAAILADTGDTVSSIDLTNKGIVVLKDGSLVFNTGDDDDGDGEDGYILKQDKSGNLSVLTSDTQLKAVTGENEIDLESIVEGADGKLYVGEDRSDNLLRVDPKTGDVDVFVKKEEFDKLGDEFDFDIQPAIAADNRYIYLASDDTPNIVYKVDYIYGKPSIFAAGPNVNPHKLSKDNVVYLVNDLFYPPRGDDSYYGLNSKKYAKKPTNIYGKYTLSFIDTSLEWPYNQITTAPIPWDATPYQVAQAIYSVLGEEVKVTGVGTIGKPWEFDTPEGYEFTGINDEYIYGASGRSSGNDGPSGGNKEAVEANNHIEALGTDAKYGSITVDLDATIGSGSSNIDQSLGEVTWHIGDSTDKIKYLLVKNTHLNPHDVSVSGKGTLHSPWVFKFKGGFERKQIEFEVNDYASDAVSADDILTGTMKDARAFDDPDGFMTRNRWGTITLEDDAGAHFLYNIDFYGDVTTLVTEWEFVRVNGGRVDIEGGLAYDSYGNLFISNHNDFDGDSISGGNILKLTPLGKLSIWVEPKDISDVTGGETEDVEVEGIAFDTSKSKSDKGNKGGGWGSWF